MEGGELSCDRRAKEGRPERGVLLNSKISLMSFARKKADLVGANALNS
jgi:hypothetical protein